MRLRSPQELKRELAHPPKQSMRTDGGVLSEESSRSREKLAESRLELALIFARSHEFDMARRRLRRITIEFVGTVAAHDASVILKKLARSARG